MNSDFIDLKSQSLHLQELINARIRTVLERGQEKRCAHSRVGVGGRMDMLQCVVVLAKLERFEWEVTQRQRVALGYYALLDGASIETAMPIVRPDRTSVYAQFTIMVPHRERMQDGLKARGIPTAVHYPVPIHKQPAYASYANGGDFPVSEYAARNVISLPMHADLDETTQQTIAAAVRELC